ncbi:MAG: thiamine-phosphate kinase, partial [Nitrososphaerales archaeon]
AVTGDFGYTGAGLYALSKYGRVSRGFVGKAISAVLKPKPPLELGLMLAERRLMSSSIDSSDGLALSLYSLSEASRVKIVVYDLPVAKGLHKFAEENGLSWEELVFYSGEEYEIVFTTPEDKLDEIKRLSKSLGRRIKVIGRVERGKPVVEYITLSGKKILERRGWIHLQKRESKIGSESAT